MNPVVHLKYIQFLLVVPSRHLQEGFISQAVFLVYHSIFLTWWGIRQMPLYNLPTKGTGWAVLHKQVSLLAYLLDPTECRAQRLVSPVLVERGNTLWERNHIIHSANWICPSTLECISVLSKRPVELHVCSCCSLGCLCRCLRWRVCRVVPSSI